MATTDCETGEYVCASFITEPKMPVFDLETGEPDCKKGTVPKRRPKFVIPKQHLKNHNDEDEKKGCSIGPNDSFSFCKKEEVLDSVKDTKYYYQTSHRLFLIVIPSLLLFMRISAFLTMLIEVALHHWVHRKNSQNTNQSIFYESPLHVITKQFCAECQQVAIMDKVSKLQDERARGWRWHLQLEEVARRIT